MNIKKHIVAFVVLLLLLSNGMVALAQPRLQQPEMQFGVEAGAMASMVIFSPSVTQSAKHPFMGTAAGVFFRYYGQKYCGLEVDVHFMQRGWRDTSNDYRLELDYIEVPFLTHIYFGRKVVGFVNLGPQIGYCIAQHHYGSKGTEPQYLSIDKPFDWGVAGGLGMYVPSAVGIWQLEARFNYSLGSIYSTRKTDYFDAANPMNLSLTVGWGWKLKQKRK